MSALYQRVADAIQDDIASGKLQPGDRLPSIRELATKHEVSETVVKNALMVLRHDGVIYGQQGKGTFVSPKE